MPTASFQMMAPALRVELRPLRLVHLRARRHQQLVQLRVDVAVLLVDAVRRRIEPAERVVRVLRVGGIGGDHHVPLQVAEVGREHRVLELHRPDLDADLLPVGREGLRHLVDRRSRS